MCDWGPWGGGVLRRHRCIMVSLPFIDYMACAHHVKCPPHFSGRISDISAQVAYGAHPSAQGGGEGGSEGGCEGGGEGMRE